MKNKRSPAPVNQTRGREVVQQIQCSVMKLFDVYTFNSIGKIHECSLALPVIGQGWR